MARISISICLLILACCIGRPEAFSYHQNVDLFGKYQDKYDYLLGPKFDTKGNFAYVKVTKLNQSPPAINVRVETYVDGSVRNGEKKFSADPGSTNISVISFDFRPLPLLTISEKLKDGHEKVMLVMWEPLSFPAPNLDLTVTHTIATRQWDFDVFVKDNATCHTSNSMCRIHFEEKSYRPMKHEFSNGDLVWSSMHIDYLPNERGILLRGFDAAGNYKFLRCDSERYGQCNELLSLPNANSAIETHISGRSFCFIENPGKDKSANCFMIDSDRDGAIKFNKTVVYDEPMSLINIEETDNYDILLVARKAYFNSTNRLDVVVNRISHDATKPITHRQMKLACENNGKLFQASITENSRQNTLMIKYTCDTQDTYYYKSLIFNNN